MSDVRRLPVGEDEAGRVTLDDLAREGARRMIAAALEAEVDEYVGSFIDEVDEDGKRLARNGRARERMLAVGSGTVPVRAPRVNDKRVDEETGKRKRFGSRILPAYARRSPKVTEVLPVLYLHGLSTGDFGPALRDLLGEDASGLSSSSIQRLTETWQAEHAAFRARELRFHRYAYLFANGVNVSVRLDEDPKVCLLVVIGVREDGEEELLAVEDGYRESEDSWAAVFRDLRERGLNEPKLVTGDSALSAWAALRTVFPGTREQRCWVHKTANVLDALPKRLQPRAKSLLHEMAEAPTRADAGKARERFREEFNAKYPKAVAKLDKDWEALTAFYAFPAEHWRHLRTTTPIESSFATVKLRIKVTKGAGSKKAALAMGYKLLDAAQERWRRVNGHELVTDVLAGVKFKDGVKVTDDDTTTDEKVAA
jgi:transposase-like protein